VRPRGEERFTSETLAPSCEYQIENHNKQNKAEAPAAVVADAGADIVAATADQQQEDDENNNDQRFALARIKKNMLQSLGCELQIKRCIYET
jgi:hypothetical protein